MLFFVPTHPVFSLHEHEHFLERIHIYTILHCFHVKSMMASPSELTLDCKPHSYSLLLKSFQDQPDQTQKLEDFLGRLEEERLKIEVFKRELPLCMQLLTEAVEASRQQLQSYRANQGARPFLEEFIPLKHPTPEVGSEKASNMSDKANWMTSAQLWSPAAGDETKQQSTMVSSKEPDIGFSVSPKLGFDNKQRNGGAFLPFSKERNSCPSPNLRALPDLALANSTDHKDGDDKKFSETENGMAFSRRENCGKVANGGAGMEQVKTAITPSEAQTGAVAATTANTQTHRKARRCWSPDLHRRFVNALQMLGGSQVATPKQIRELMKVDGLTNDEVKSHLQKYRLHTRRPSPSPQAAGPAAPQLVVGIWVPPEYATAAHAGGPTIYGGHPPSHASPHYCGPPVPQDFYAAPPQAHHQMHHHSLHHQLHMYKASPQTQNSPDSEVRGVGDRSESIEDGKSESSSWKGESGDNGERKGLVALRDDGEESNRAMEVRLLSSSNF